MLCSFLIYGILSTFRVVASAPVAIETGAEERSSTKEAEWPREVSSIINNTKTVPIDKFINDINDFSDSYDLSDKDAGKYDDKNDDNNDDNEDVKAKANQMKEKEKEDQKLEGPQTEEEQREEEDAEMNPKLFEGDLKITQEDVNDLDKNTVSKKDTIAAAERIWPNARVPIVLDATYDDARKATLIKAIREFNTKTCVRFVPKKPTDMDFIRFTVDQGCYSTSIGRNHYGGEQQISIGKGCNFAGTVIHEIMHAIGFFHEHTRLDRDQYVTINWVNIENGRESQFKKYPHGEGDYLGEPYDYESVMHYPRDGFGVTISGKKLPTLVPKDKPWRKIGQRNGFSNIDLNQINKLYRCTMKS